VSFVAGADTDSCAICRSSDLVVVGVSRHGHRSSAGRGVGAGSSCCCSGG